MLYIFIKNHGTSMLKMDMPTKKYFIEKANKLCLMDQIVIESHSFLEYRQNR